ncbi:MAG: acyl-coenzyme A thioesterase PaaI-like protein [Myxococcota bacterium]|jgi:acyl-coenzyme A thioesterase PaaI-like protein
MTDREPIDPLTFGPDQQCFGCGPHNHTGMQLQFFREGDAVVTTFLARDGWEGPPGIVHGGLQATLADEIGAWTLVGLRNRFGFTASANLRWLRPARTDRPVEARGQIVDDDDLSASVRVKLSQDGRTVLTGKIRYVYATIAQAERILGQPLPEAWHHLARPTPE